ncbi:MAG: ATP-binding protein [Anaerolineae bacterium]|nr:ATP-binding protein [Anaerolineae bacterium]
MTKSAIDRLQERIRDLTFLHETSRVLTSTLDLDGVLHSLMSQVREYFQVDAASAALLDEATGEIVFRVAVGKASDEVIGLRLRPGQGIAGWVIQTGEPTIVPVAHADARFYSIIDERTDFYTHAMLAVPVKIEGLPIGVIEVLNPAAGCFTQKDQELLLAVADIAAIAIRNARLYERARQAEQRYETLFNESSDPIVVLAPDGRILNFNRRARELLSQSSTGDGELADAHFWQVTGIDEEEFQTLLLQVRAGKSLKTELKLTIQTEEGEELRTLEATMTRINYGGYEAIQWIGHDISERVAFEQLRTNLINMIIHDLRNPLGSIMGSLQLLYTGLVERDQTLPFKKLVNNAIRSGQKMYRLIDSLLDTGRFEAGEAELKKVPVSPAALMQEAFEQIHPLALNKGLKLESYVEPDLPTVVADPDIILRVLTNLLDNAVKYTFGPGLIKMEARQVEREIVFSVTDTGPGIPPEAQQRVFDRFVRLESAEGTRGTGLGLAFCKLAVEAHGGRIWVESEAGRGATFRFTLPMDHPAAQAPASRRV